MSDRVPSSAELREAAAEDRRHDEAATEGPWQVDGPWWWHEGDSAPLVSVGEDRDAVVIEAPEGTCPPKRGRDIEAIVHARNSLASRAALLEGAAKGLEEAREVIEWWRQYTGLAERVRLSEDPTEYEDGRRLLALTDDVLARLAGGERDTPASTEKWDAVAEAHLATGRPDRAPPSTEGEA